MSLKILEHFVGATLGEDFVDELRKPTDRDLAIESALENSEKRFATEFSDKIFAARMFAQVGNQNLGLISDAIEKFSDHPTDPDFHNVLNKIIVGSFPEINTSHAGSAVDVYIKILTEEFALADETFREHVRALSDLRMVELLKRIESRQFPHEPFLPVAPNKLLGDIPPAKVSRYIHRGKIEDDVRALLRDGGVGAIVGLRAPGGLGKTELAKHASEDLKSYFEEVLWVNVNEKTAPQVVADMLLQCGVQVQPGASYAMQKNELRGWLQNHRLLIIFDDLRENALDDLANILPPKPCSALVTSRINDIAAVPKIFALDVMSETQALELFGAVLDDEAMNVEKATYQKLAERCKYNPLALEIAAHRILQMKGFDTPAKLYLAKAEKRFEELYASGDERWNMTAVFDLSYFDLNETDRSRFHQLAAFHNTGFAPNAAAHLWDMEQAEADRTINRFVNLSLLKTVPGAIERYRLHDLLDEYAALKLSPSGEEAQAKNAIVKWLVDLFDEHFTEDQTTAPEVKLEMDNLERSAEWLISQKDGSGLANITRAARNWFVVLSLHHKWGQWSELALSFGIEDQRLRANMLQAIGDVQQFRDDRDAALASYNAALTLFKAVGDKLGEANVYLSLGGLKRNDRDFAGAKSDFQNAFAIYKMIGDQYSQARALYRLGDVLSDEEKYQDALHQYEQAASLWNSIGVVDLVESILSPRIEEARKHL